MQSESFSRRSPFTAGASATLAARMTPIHRRPLDLVFVLFFSVAVLYVLQLAHLVAAVQVIVYAGAVMTLFLFVIMLIGVDKVESTEENLPMQRIWVSVIAAAIIRLGSGCQHT